MFFATFVTFLAALTFSNPVVYNDTYNNHSAVVTITGNITDVLSPYSGTDRFHIYATQTENGVSTINKVFWFYIEDNENAFCEYGWEGFSNVSYYFDFELYYNSNLVASESSLYMVEYADYLTDGTNVPFDSGGFIINNYKSLTNNYDYANTTYRLTITFMLLDAEEYSHFLEDYENGYGLGYQTGYDDGNSDGYDSGYGNGYDDGYGIGYQTGLVDGYDNADMSFIFSGIVQVGMLPVNFFLAILNWEIFGINIGGFVQGLLSLALILIIVRFVIGNFGGSGDK